MIVATVTGIGVTAAMAEVGAIAKGAVARVDKVVPIR